MGFIKEYRDYLEGIKAAVGGINKIAIIDEPGELNSFINDLSSGENTFMAGVLPAFGNNSPDDGDQYRARAYAEIVFIDKVDASADGQDAFIDAFDKVHSVAEEVRKILLNDHLGDQGCTMMRFLNVQSVQLVPFNRSQVKGWNLIYSFDVWE